MPETKQFKDVIFKKWSDIAKTFWVLTSHSTVAIFVKGASC